MQNPEVLAVALEGLLDWLDNLEHTVGTEVLVNHMPNNSPSRASLRDLLGERRRADAAPEYGTVDHRMFVKEQRALIRAL